MVFSSDPLRRGSTRWRILQNDTRDYEHRILARAVLWAVIPCLSFIHTDGDASDKPEPKYYEYYIPEHGNLWPQGVTAVHRHGSDTPNYRKNSLPNEKSIKSPS